MDNKEQKSIPDSTQVSAYEDVKFQMHFAKLLVSSGALKVKTAEEAFVLMQAGREMGLNPMESLQKLYIVNGNVSFWGRGMLAELTKQGIEFSYTEETEHGVTVTAKLGEKIFVEKVLRSDPAFKNSKAILMNAKNKMRWHGIKMIANFYFPHLLGAEVWEKDDMAVSYEIQQEISEDNFPEEKEMDPIIKAIQACKTIEEVEAYLEANKKMLTKNVKYMVEIGKAKKQFSEDKNPE